MARRSLVRYAFVMRRNVRQPVKHLAKPASARQLLDAIGATSADVKRAMRILKSSGVVLRETSLAMAPAGKRKAVVVAQRPNSRRKRASTTSKSRDREQDVGWRNPPA